MHDQEYRVYKNLLAPQPSPITLLLSFASCVKSAFFKLLDTAVHGMGAPKGWHRYHSSDVTDPLAPASTSE